MKGLLMKDFLTIKKKYGMFRVWMDLGIVVILMLILRGAAALYISLLLIPLEAASMLITVINCDEQWKWGKYAVALPVSKKTDRGKPVCFCGSSGGRRFLPGAAGQYGDVFLFSVVPVWILSVFICGFLLRCTPVPILYSAVQLSAGSQRGFCRDVHSHNHIDRIGALVETDRKCSHGICSKSF